MAIQLLDKLEDSLRYAEDEDNLKDFPIRGGYENLSYKAKKFVDLLRTISRGTMLVTGEVGAGKDLFAIMITFLFRHLMFRRVLLDFKPKKLFDMGDSPKYVLFNAQVMMQEINKMAKAAGVEGIQTSQDQEEYDDFIEEATVKWALEGEGLTLLQGAVVYLQELKNYCYNRESNRRFNKFIGKLNAVVRHIDALIIGTHVKENEIDVKTFLQYAKIRAHCTWCLSKPNTTEVKIRRLALATADAVYSNIEGRPVTIYVNAVEPQSILDGKSWGDLYQTKNMINLRPVVSSKL